MPPEIARVIVWVIIGALAGSLTGVVVKRKKEGFGRLANLGVGLVGAVIGGGIVQIFGIDFGLGEITISFEDLVAAFLGSLLFLAAIAIMRKVKARRNPIDKAEA